MLMSQVDEHDLSFPKILFFGNAETVPWER